MSPSVFHSPQLCCRLPIQPSHLVPSDNFPASDGKGGSQLLAAPNFINNARASEIINVQRFIFKPLKLLSITLVTVLSSSWLKLFLNSPPSPNYRCRNWKINYIGLLTSSSTILLTEWDMIPSYENIFLQWVDFQEEVSRQGVTMIWISLIIIRKVLW